MAAQKQRRIHHLFRSRIGTVSFLLFLLFLAACSLLNRGPNYTLGAETELQGSGVLVCSPSCLNRGQCGSSPEGQVVLAGSDSPRVTDHDRLFNHETAVQIISFAPITLEPAPEGEPFQINFYNIAETEGAPAAWVAGWCLAAP